MDEAPRRTSSEPRADEQPVPALWASEFDTIDKANRLSLLDFSRRAEMLATNQSLRSFPSKLQSYKPKDWSSMIEKIHRGEEMPEF